MQLQALDRNGVPIGNDALDILANGHAAYVLTDRIPALARQASTLVVPSNVSKLSEVGIRMNVTGGMTFTSIPILSTRLRTEAVRAALGHRRRRRLLRRWKEVETPERPLP